METGFYDNLIEKGMVKVEDMEPELGPYHFYIESYSELSTCKSNGMGPSAIPFTAIVDYARIYNIDDFDGFIYLIRVMDSFVIKKQQENSDAK